MRVLAVLGLLATPVAAQQADCASQTTQLAVNQCAEQAFLAADAELNAAYAEVRGLLRRIDADLPAEQRGAEVALRDGQRAWITFRDQSCLAESYTWFGGSGRPMVYSGCKERLTRQRAADLWMLMRG